MWIRCSERLPPKNTEVILSNGVWVTNGWLSYEGKYFETSESTVSGVTHWMPLPEPPKVDE